MILHTIKIASINKRNSLFKIVAKNSFGNETSFEITIEYDLVKITQSAFVKIQFAI